MQSFYRFLIDHYAGNFSLWLNAEQVQVLPIGYEPPLSKTPAPSKSNSARRIRVELDASSHHMKAKISAAEQMQVTPCS